MIERKIIIVGGGAQAKYVVDICSLLGYKIAGILDIENNKKYHGTKIKDVTVLGYYLDLIDDFEPEEYSIVICHSNNKTKEKTYHILKKRGYTFPKIVHPKAYISAIADIGEGCIINSNSSIMPFAKIGKCAVIHSNCVVEHDCIVGDFVNIAPSATLAGYSQVGDRSYIYTNATILPGVKVGKDVIVGAGAVVVRDVEDGKVVKGIPAK